MKIIYRSRYTLNQHEEYTLADVGVSTSGKHTSPSSLCYTCAKPAEGDAKVREGFDPLSDSLVLQLQQ